MNIKSKKKGFMSIEIVFAASLFMFILLCTFIIEIYILDFKYDSAKSALTISNLAVYKDIDLKKLGQIPQIINIKEDGNTALNTFKYHLKTNMSLDENMSPVANSIVTGEVKITRFIIYNVTGNNIKIIDYNSKTNLFTTKTVSNIVNNPVYTPRGLLVKETTIHSEIEFPIKFILKGLIGEERIIKVSVDTDVIQ